MYAYKYSSRLNTEVPTLSDKLKMPCMELNENTLQTQNDAEVQKIVKYIFN